MSVSFFEKDNYRHAVEAISGGKETVMYDKDGNPSVMVRIPKLYLDEIFDGAPHVPHPAFVVNGVELGEIWISKYLNVVHDKAACSLPGQDPAINVSFDDAMSACSSKGPGWHLMTNAEWAAIALWCRKAGKMPRGNSGRNASSDMPWEIARRVGEGDDYRTLTGTGPDSWNHDGTPFGISDLNGNLWEWLDGAKLVNGRIFVQPDNNYTVGNIEGVTDGWIDTGLYFDNTTPGDDDQSFHNVGGIPFISTERKNIMYTGGDTTLLYGLSTVKFNQVQAKKGVVIPDLLKYLALYPADRGDHGGDGLLVRNYGERVCLRGGRWLWGEDAGVFCLALGYAHKAPDSRIGFRAAYTPVD